MQNMIQSRITFSGLCVVHEDLDSRFVYYVVEIKKVIYLVAVLNCLSQVD